MGKKKLDNIEEIIQENISVEPLEEVMGDRYATYAKYVIQDRAIPDVRDGLKPVQRRIIFSMFKSGNTFNKPTKKCAHTVGAVMGTFHPHGDTSIYEALARMSQDWKVRYPLIDFQGNNGSIDGDSPAAYRYTESRLSELSNELIREIDKDTVDMQLNFDDTELEPIVLPSRFPNLLVNGTEGIAVALATEIPPHNLKEVIEAVIYRIGHKTATVEDLMQFVVGPDFPCGGKIYKSEGLNSIYLTGRGRIEVASKTEIVQTKDLQQIVITEIPYKVVKIQLVYEIDKIIHSKTIDGLIEVRDESDWKGIRIVIDCKKDAKVDIILKYLKSKTSLVTSYSANMVAIDNGRPKTLNLLDYVDAYVAHQVDVVTRKTRYDLDKCNSRLHIVEGLIIATVNITEVVNIIRASKDKADSKVNLMNRFNLSNDQAEAIVTMPLYKLSHTDETILLEEKANLLKEIEFFTGILEDSKKLDRVIIKDLKEIAEKYGDDRRTAIQEKEAVEPIDKRALIAEEEVMISVSRDGYIKRSSIKSYKGSNEGFPGLKDGDMLVASDKGLTTDYLILFTDNGNFITIPVHNIQETKWKDEGSHINAVCTLGPGEKILKAIVAHELREDIFLAILTKFGQIKRMSLASLDLLKRSRPAKFMKLLNQDVVVGVEVLTGNSDLLVITSNGNTTYFNENELSVLGAKAGGVKSISNLGKNYAVSLLAFDEDEKSKVVLMSNKAHYRIFDNTKLTKTLRLGRTFNVMPCFKNDIHVAVGAYKLNKKDENPSIDLFIDNQTMFEYQLPDTYLSDLAKYAKKNIDAIDNKSTVTAIINLSLERIDKNTVSHPIIVKEKEDEMVENDSEGPSISEPKPVKEEKKEEGFEQISIFDDLDE